MTAATAAQGVARAARDPRRGQATTAFVAWGVAAARRRGTPARLCSQIAAGRSASARSTSPDALATAHTGPGAHRGFAQPSARSTSDALSKTSTSDWGEMLLARGSVSNGRERTEERVSSTPACSSPPLHSAATGPTSAPSRRGQASQRSARRNELAKHLEREALHPSKQPDQTALHRHESDRGPRCRKTVHTSASSR
jgi:hypothetical protein